MNNTKLQVLILMVLLSACGRQKIITVPGAVGQNGTNGNDGANGQDGAQGPMGPMGPIGLPGANGSDGASCSVVTVLPSPAAPNGGAQITCGSSITIVLNGTDGSNGTNGQDGADGQDGTTPAAVAYQVVDIVDPCGNAAGINDEVFLKLYNGRLLASFSDTQGGLNTRFSLIEPGSYRTTDASNCYFTVNNDYSISNEHY